MKADESVVARLRAAGCVWAEDEAAALASAARSEAELAAFVARRALGEPLEQVVGWASFAGLRILVDPGVFVPRRRSEFLVSVAARLARQTIPVTSDDSRVSAARVVRPTAARGSGPVIVDLCCGTGALGLAVTIALGDADEAAPGAGALRGDDAPPGGGASTRGAPAGGPGLPVVELHAADLDPSAVACARRNVEPAGGRVYQGDLFAALPPELLGQVNVLICNAPYVPSSEITFLPAEAREHEAPMALDGGSDGLSVLRRAAAGAAQWLAPGGVLLVETSDRQAASMAAAMETGGLTALVHSDDDWGATVVSGTASARHRGR